MRMLYVRPSSWCVELNECVHCGGVCPGSVGTRQALLQGWLLCVGFVRLANVPGLVCGYLSNGNICDVLIESRPVYAIAKFQFLEYNHTDRIFHQDIALLCQV